MDLRFHDDGAAVLLRDRLGLVGRRRYFPRRDRHALAAKNLLGLILVDVHTLSAVADVLVDVMVVPALPRTANLPCASDVITARPFVRRTKSIAARIFGA